MPCVCAVHLDYVSIVMLCICICSVHLCCAFCRLTGKQSSAFPDQTSVVWPVSTVDLRSRSVTYQSHFASSRVVCLAWFGVGGFSFFLFPRGGGEGGRGGSEVIIAGLFYYWH